MLFVADDVKPINPLIPSWPDIIWSSVVLAIVFAILGKYVIPKLLRIADERTEKIEGGLARAQAEQDEAKALLQQYQAQLNTARDDAAKIRDEARSEGQLILNQLKTEAHSEADRIIDAGKTQLEVQRKQVITELRSDLGRASVVLAEKLLGHDLDSDTKKVETVNNFISQLDSQAVHE